MKMTHQITVLAFLVFSLVFSAYTIGADNKSAESVEDENAQVINNMKSGGFDFSRSHIVDFFALFSTKKEADSVANLYRKENTNTKLFKLVEVKKDENGDHELLVQILMDVTYDNINDFEKKLAARAVAKNGKFNGWGVFR